jgi:hypothetical protein
VLAGRSGNASRALAKTARDSLAPRANSPAEKKELAEIDAWLTAHGGK